MITYDLKCHNGHNFEGWFSSRDAFEAQLDEGLIQCPVCESTAITKRLSAVAVHVGKGAKPLPKKEDAPNPRAFFQALGEFVEKNFEDVGPGFAAEARKMEAGEAENRSICGTTTPEEEEALREEGIDFTKIALPKYDA